MFSSPRSKQVTLRGEIPTSERVTVNFQQLPNVYLVRRGFICSFKSAPALIYASFFNHNYRKSNLLN